MSERQASTFRNGAYTKEEERACRLVGRPVGKPHMTDFCYFGCERN